MKAALTGLPAYCIKDSELTCGWPSLKMKKALLC
jgi:hypothetical protein